MHLNLDNCVTWYLSEFLRHRMFFQDHGYISFFASDLILMVNTNHYITLVYTVKHTTVKHIFQFYFS